MGRNSMKRFILLLSLLIFTILYPQGSVVGNPNPGTTVKGSEGLYEFTLTGEWKEFKNPGTKIERMFVTPDNLGRFFVLRIPNPPHAEIKEEQLNAYIDGLKRRYQNLQVLENKVVNKYNTSVGIAIFTYDENAPKGSLKIHNYCEVMIYKKNYFNVCGVSPERVWEKEREKILKTFSSLKFL